MAETRTSDSYGNAVTAEEAWDYLRALADEAKAGKALVKGALSQDAPCIVAPEAPRGWVQNLRPLSAGAAHMFDLYTPLCVGDEANTYTAAHLGQSLDGRIATHSGASQFITGEENLVHTHRMRALFDAVVVGAHTAHHDNPRLTTRLTSGEHATRVLIDPRCSASASASMFVDGMSETIVVCEEGAAPKNSSVQHLEIASEDGVLAPAGILAALRARGLRRIFIEGGGVTVSRFLGAGCLSRLHICVAPMIIGSGRPAIVLPEVSNLEESHFLKAKHFSSGPDILFDCQLRS